MAKLMIHSVDQRFSKRIRALRQATIACGDEIAGMDCAILDISASGARLQPNDPKRVPEQFRLRLTPTLTIGCEVVYRDTVAVGVAFLAE